ncbi:MAG: hypothetical protein SH850_11030 [Planctomycetaceae bacterium]|nr:hypothetical protein [Planctomycetaceae bacterium]
MRLGWEQWFRSEGAREHMGSLEFNGTNFGALFWDAMRLVFLDEQGHEGVLYSGAVYPKAQAFIQENGGRNGFTLEGEEKMLKYGNFKYHTTQTIGSINFLVPHLRIEGPDAEDSGNRVFAKTTLNGRMIEFNFYLITEVAKARHGENATGADFIRWFSGAVMLHEIMHNHSFNHPNPADWTFGSDYAKSLPHVALVSVMRCSPFAADFSNQSADAGGVDLATYHL